MRVLPAGLQAVSSGQGASVRVQMGSRQLTEGATLRLECRSRSRFCSFLSCELLPSTREARHCQGSHTSIQSAALGRFPPSSQEGTYTHQSPRGCAFVPRRDPREGRSRLDAHAVECAYLMASPRVHCVSLRTLGRRQRLKRQVNYHRHVTPVSLGRPWPCC